MSSPSQGPRSFVALVLLAAFAVLAVPAAAQDQTHPDVDLFVGYSFFDSNAKLSGLQPEAMEPIGACLEENPLGVGTSLTYNFNSWLGLTGDFSAHWGTGNGDPALLGLDDSDFYTLSVGPKLTFRRDHFAPFVEALVGWHRLNTNFFGTSNAPGFMVGGGIDVPLTRRFGLRLARADYVYSNHQFGSEAIVRATKVRGLRLQTGLLFLFGVDDEVPVSAHCSLTPDNVWAGEPVTTTVIPRDFHPDHDLTYTWTANGGKVRGHHATSVTDTTGLAAGRYTVMVRVSDPRKRPGGEASCSSYFTVREPVRNPPIVACTADPATVETGSHSTVRCSCTSPDGVAVALANWSADGGSLSGSGSNRTLDTTGVPAGSITVSATCADSRGLSSHAQALVAVTAEVEKLQRRLALRSIYFATAKPTEQDPHGGLLLSQRQTLVSLATDFQQYLRSRPAARLILDGHADPRASQEYNQSLSQRRVEAVRRFLIAQGVPAANIEIKAFGEQDNLTEAQVRDAVARTPELSEADRQMILDNLTTVMLASNRRVDVTLSTTGQESIRQYPFNAADSLTLLKQAQVE